MRPLTRMTALAALLGALASAGAAAAQEGPEGGPGGPMMMMRPGGIDFVAIDTDGNGSLSRAELQARAVARLAKADANGDGFLDRDELIAAMPGPHGGVIEVFSADPAEGFADRMLALMGATETGRVEIVALGDRRVNTLLAFADTDRDAAISQAEADAIKDRHARMHGPGGRGDHGDRGGSRMGRPGPGPDGPDGDGGPGRRG